MDGTETTEPRGRSRAREGLLLGRYRLLSRLGAGGFGVVWLAHDERLEREVAVKVIPRVQRSEPDRSPRLGRDARSEREAKVAARLNHPGIVSLYELGTDEEAVYLVSELVRGRTFAELHRAGALSDRDVGRVGAALCDALAHAHAKGVVHRDVKPQNVIVLAEPAAGAGFVKLTDFGVAHLAGDEPLTRTGDVVGTLAYMAPEQAEGERVGPPADVYALALTLYEGWTGTNPVRAPGPAATARRLGHAPPPLRAGRRDLPVGLGDAIDAALDPWPERRPPLAALREALEEADAALSDEGGLVEPATLDRVGLTRRRHGRRRRRVPPVDPPPGHGFPGARAGWVLGRAAAGLAAGALVLAALAPIGPPPRPPALAAAGAVALGVILAPGLGWLAGAAIALGWNASPGVGNDGATLVAAVALAPTPALLPRAGALWSLPALAPLLAAAGLGPAFAGVAALASTPRRRAGVAAAGFLWLAAAEAIHGGPLLFGAPAEVPDPEGWSGSVAGAIDVLSALVTSPALAPAGAWAVFAAILPVAVRGRSLVLDVARGAAWAAGLVAAHVALADLLAGTVGRDGARGAVVGSAVALAVALAGAAARSHRPATAP